MRAPGFWFAPPGMVAAALAPLAGIWRLGTWVRRVSTRPETAPLPVICIGNLTAGGAGKTPMAAAWLARLTEQGYAPHLVTRGYGGRERGPHRVDPLADQAERVGDEALLLASWAPVWVARDRAAGARAAAAAGADLVLLDDGFQNPGLRKDASVLMVDAGRGFGNGRVIPAGPLREPVGPGLARADAVVLLGSDKARAAAVKRWPGLSDALDAELCPVETGLALKGLPVVAFAGIGRPEKFFETLHREGARLIGAHGFPDHHVYAPQVLRRLVAEARRAGAMLLTTEKDAVRLAPEFRREVMAVPVRLEVADWAPLDRIVAALAPK